MLNPIKTLFGAIKATTERTFKPRLPKPLRHHANNDAQALSMFDEKHTAAFGWKRQRTTNSNGFGGTGTRVARFGGYRKGQPGAKLIRKMIRRYGYVPVMLTQPVVRASLAAKSPKAATV